ncbi:MAG: oxygen-independent coproporphyrinogen III oxidase-like protein [Nitrosomonadales bacterium]|nr:MAG: oxygen-independent coproporphyrinogen III oxidase-like protein [Nitrosomonadales bacterium]
MKTASLALPGTLALSAPPPLSLYIHIPWCVRKCPYCDFNSHQADGGVPEMAYAEALLRDLELALPQIWGRKIGSIFFGGGTPSILSGEALDKILCGIRALVPLEAGAEISLEANPGTVDANRFAEYRAAGVNRLSLGIQSFNRHHLKALGRIHDEHEARQAVELARAHFDNINLDLMYALPGQTLEEVLSDIHAALDYKPQHLSAYHLTIEPNTWFYHHPPEVPDDDLSASMQEEIESLLAAHGYQHYETSAFSLAQHQCRHNLNYWLFGDYLGIGAGAHSKLSLPDRIVRQARQRQPQAYLEASGQGRPIQTEQEVLIADLGFEFMMNVLRLTGGFSLGLFARRTGLSVAALQDSLDVAVQRGLLEIDGQHVRPTLLGQRFLNDLLQLFLTGDDV